MDNLFYLELYSYYNDKKEEIEEMNKEIYNYLPILILYLENKIVV